MMYLVTDDGVKLFDDDYNPITLDAALVTIRRVSAYVEAIGEPERRADPTATVDSQTPRDGQATEDARSDR